MPDMARQQSEAGPAAGVGAGSRTDCRQHRFSTRLPQDRQSIARVDGSARQSGFDIGRTCLLKCHAARRLGATVVRPREKRPAPQAFARTHHHRTRIVRDRPTA
jgi:hypothetical protein